MSHIYIHGNGTMLAMAADGIRYVLADGEIRFASILYAVTNALGYAVISIILVVTVKMFHATPRALGYLIAASATGSISGAILVSVFHGVSARRLVIAGFLLMGISILAFSSATDLHFGLPLLFLSGCGFTAASSTLHALVQNMVEESMRGRVMGIIVWSLFTGITVGNLALGKAADWLGASSALAVNGILLLIATIPIFLFREKIPDHVR